MPDARLPGIPSADDLIHDLVWPKLIRAGGLAVQPDRLVLAFFTFMLAMFIGNLSVLFSDAPPLASQVLELKMDALGGLVEGVVHANFGEFGAAARSLGDAPARIIESYPIAALLLLIPAGVVAAIGGGAISRAAAVDFCTSTPQPWTMSLAHAIRHGWRHLGAIFGPVILAMVVALLLALAGWALLSFPGVDWVGGALFGIAMLISAAIALLLLCLACGSTMLLPAVACEETDSIDAVQRVVAYALGTPIRLVLYLALLLAMGIALTLVFDVLAMLTVSIAESSTGAFLSEPRQEAIFGTPDTDPHRLIAFWRHIPEILIGTFMTSYVFCAGTLLYLTLRKVNDNQELDEIFTEGLY